MYILENVPLNNYSTMRLGGTAAFLTEVSTRQEIIEAANWAAERGLPIMVIGEGSNIIWDDDGYPGLVVVNKILGITVSADSDISTYITAGAGEHWDSFVDHTVQQGLTGIEFLSLIPGTVGATPVQNVGAYGAEVSETITTIEAYDTTEKKMVIIRGGECDFSYRNSRFKTADKGRYLITAVTFFLQKSNPVGPFYGAVETYLREHAIDAAGVTPAVIREAVIAIRSSKLPDPKLVANNGSFFANPIISTNELTQLLADYPDIPRWEMPDNRTKLSAAWLIEQAGFKDYHDAETGMATWHKQPLVLVNEHAETTAQLKSFRQKILDAVQAKFNITLEQEPELV